MFGSPVATIYEVAGAIVSAALYLTVGVAAAARAPRDVRAGVFLVSGIASVPPYLITILLWARGPGAAFTLPVMTLVGLSLMVGSLALFHFTQVFPWRRPWIRAHGRWLLAGYLFVPIALALPIVAFGPFIVELASVSSASVATTGSGGLGAVSVGISESLVLLLIVIPVLFVLGLVLPFAALFSLYKSWLAAKTAGVQAARVTTFWILISQMAGGVLTILIIPLLHLVAPTGPWVTIAATLLYAFGLLMPVAFAVGVWKYRVLDLDLESPPAKL
jgi:hypothetical protein